MPSVITHSVVALGGVKMLPGRSRSSRMALWSVICSVLPDADVLAFALGIPYGHMLGHRGLTHSLSFALLLSVVVVSLVFSTIPRFSRSWWALIAFFFAVTASHGLLDALTDGGLGVAFFAPIDWTRYFLPWRPVSVSPIGLASFLSERGVRVLISEIVWIWIPLGIILVLRIYLLNIYKKER